jgi:carbamoyl-phosphate synthase large subunit
LSLGPVVDKYAFHEEARAIVDELELPLFATDGTFDALRSLGIACTRVGKRPDDPGPSAMKAIEQGLVDLVINIPREFDDAGRPDGYFIRRAAVDAHVPLLTEIQLARAVVDALRVHAGGARPKRHLALDEVVPPPRAPSKR